VLRFPAGVALLSLLQSVQNVSRSPPPITYEMGTGALFIEAKWPGRESASLSLSSTEVMNAWRYISSLAYALMVCTEKVYLYVPISCAVVTMPT
jgi:hypothetical protein